MKVASLYSGIGALDHGLRMAGHEIILQVECNPHCVQVLQQRFPGLPLIRDAASVLKLPKETELLVGGFPCTVRVFSFHCRRTSLNDFLL